MIQDMLGSVASASAYRRFAAEKGSRAFFYLIFLSFLFTIGSAVALKLKLAPVIDQTFQWLETSVPKLTFSNGKVTSDTTGPVRLAHPQLPGLAVMIDTQRTTPVNLRDLTEAKVQAYLTGNAMYLERRPGELETYDLSKAALDRPAVVDPAFFREAARAFKIIVYPASIVAVFFLFATVTVVVALINGVLGLILNSLMGGSLPFGSLFKIGLHAQTTSTLARLLTAFLPFGIPLVGILLAIVTSVYTYFGVKACIRPETAGAGELPAA